MVHHAKPLLCSISYVGKLQRNYADKPRALNLSKYWIKAFKLFNTSSFAWISSQILLVFLTKGKQKAQAHQPLSMFTPFCNLVLSFFFAKRSLCLVYTRTRFSPDSSTKQYQTFSSSYRSLYPSSSLFTLSVAYALLHILLNTKGTLLNNIILLSIPLYLLCTLYVSSTRTHVPFTYLNRLSNAITTIFQFFILYLII